MNEHPTIDPAVVRGLALPRLSRRNLLRSAGVGLGAFALSQLLAACGEETTGGAGGGGPTGAAGGFDWSTQKKAGEVTFVNWPLYIDKDKVSGEVVHPTLENFTKEAGISVEYLELIDSYEEFHAKIFPLLASGQPLGYDLIVTGYPKWFPLMIQLGYLIPLDHSLLPNYTANVAGKYTTVGYDPGNRYGIPFQSGMTGLAYNIDLTGREITSLQELFNPEFEGKVGMFRDTLDTPNMTLLSLGVEPPESTEDDWRRAADMLIKQRDEGILRQYYGQGYITALQSGDVALSLAWGGDVLQAQNSGYDNLRFIVPDEGAMLWTDIIAIPVGAEHPLDAITLMDWYYRPDVAAKLTAWIQSVSPVPEAQRILADEGDPVADSPLVFPTQDIYARLHDYRELTPEETEVWDDLFLSIYQA